MLITESLFIISPFIAILMLFFYKTDFIIVYGKLFHMEKILKIDEYEKTKKMDLELKYHVFLATRYKNFFVKLITCQICLSTWLSILFTLIFSLTCFNLMFLYLIPFNIVLGNLIYNLIHKSL